MTCTENIEPLEDCDKSSDDGLYSPAARSFVLPFDAIVYRELELDISPPSTGQAPSGSEAQVMPEPQLQHSTTPTLSPHGQEYGALWSPSLSMGPQGDTSSPASVTCIPTIEAPSMQEFSINFSPSTNAPQSSHLWCQHLSQDPPHVQGPPYYPGPLIGTHPTLSETKHHSAPNLPSTTALPADQDDNGLSCGWIEGGRKCGKVVTPDDLNVHLACAHGISNLPGGAVVYCRWCCPPMRMKRESILRHVREVHFGIRRYRQAV